MYLRDIDMYCTKEGNFKSKSSLEDSSLLECNTVNWWLVTCWKLRYHICRVKQICLTLKTKALCSSEISVPSYKA